MKERQSINLFCYLCYVKIRILGKYIHPKFTLKCGCGAAEEARAGLSVCAVSAEGTHVTVCRSTLGSLSVCCLTSSGGGRLERVLHGLKSCAQAIFTPLLSAVI